MNDATASSTNPDQTLECRRLAPSGIGLTGIGLVVMLVLAPHPVRAQSVSVLAQLGEDSGSTTKLADIDGDGRSEVIFTTTDSSRLSHGRIHVLSPSGEELPGWPVTLADCPLLNSPAVGDIDGDGRPEIVVETFWDQSRPGSGGLNDRQQVWAFDMRGIGKPGFPFQVGVGGTTWFGVGGIMPSPSLVDLNGDGASEIVAVALGVNSAASAPRLLAIRGDSTLVFDTDLPRSTASGREYMNYSVPMSANLVGDAAPEIIVGVHASSERDSLFAVTAQGAILPGWPVRLEPGSQQIIEFGAVGDLDGDGYDELVVTHCPSAADAASLYVFDGLGHVRDGFPQTLPGTAPYTKYQGRPALADVNHDGFTDIVSVISDQLNNYLVAYDGAGRQLAKVSVPGRQYWILQGLALLETASGSVCAVFPVLSDGQALRLLINAACLDGTTLPGYPLEPPRLCFFSFCHASPALAVTTDRDSDGAYGVLVDYSGNVFRFTLLTSKPRSLPWPQFQSDAASSGRFRSPAPCNYSLPQATRSFSAAAGADTVGVVVSTNTCGRWAATSNTPWLVVTGGSTGVGNQNVTFAVSANRGAHRTGTLTIAGRTVTVTQASPSPGAGDFDGDAIGDLAVYRPSTGQWFLRYSRQGYAIEAGQWYFQWGSTGDLPQLGFFDGDGLVDLAIYRPGTGQWFLLYSSRGYDTASYGYVQWGPSGDVPLVTDFDADGRTDLCVYSTQTGSWSVRLSTTNYVSGTDYQWGSTGDVPVPGDFDGDGRADIAVFRPSTGQWFIRYSSHGYDPTQFGYAAWGAAGDVPLSADFDGDGRADIGVFRPSTGQWFLLYSSRGLDPAAYAYFSWGSTGDLPRVIDFDGDGRADVSVYRPGGGQWFVRYSTRSYDPQQSGYFQWGTDGDWPITTATGTTSGP